MFGDIDITIWDIDVAIHFVGLTMTNMFWDVTL